MAQRRPDQPGESRAKPLHWTRMLWNAAGTGSVAAMVVCLLVTGFGGYFAFQRVFVWGLLGAVGGLLVVSALERFGVFTRADE